MSGDTRLWMYRKGEARLFGRPDHVPEGEDWQRFPVIAEEAAEVPASATEARGAELSQDERLDRMSRRRLMQVAGDCGVRFDMSWSKAQLKQAISEVLYGNRT